MTSYTLYLPGSVIEFRRRAHPFRLVLEARRLDPDFHTPYDGDWFPAPDADLVNLQLAGCDVRALEPVAAGN